MKEKNAMSFNFGKSMCSLQVEENHFISMCLAGDQEVKK